MSGTGNIQEILAQHQWQAAQVIYRAALEADARFIGNQPEYAAQKAELSRIAGEVLQQVSQDTAPEHGEDVHQKKKAPGTLDLGLVEQLSAITDSATAHAQYELMCEHARYAGALHATPHQRERLQGQHVRPREGVINGRVVYRGPDSKFISKNKRFMYLVGALKAGSHAAAYEESARMRDLVALRKDFYNARHGALGDPVTDHFKTECGIANVKPNEALGYGLWSLLSPAEKRQDTAMDAFVQELLEGVPYPPRSRANTDDGTAQAVDGSKKLRDALIAKLLMDAYVEAFVQEASAYRAQYKAEDANMHSFQIHRNNLSETWGILEDFAQDEAMENSAFKALLSTQMAMNAYMSNYFLKMTQELRDSGTPGRTMRR